MKNKITTIFIMSTIGFSAYGYEGPTPLQNIIVDFSGSIDKLSGLYSYSYSVKNPVSNNGEIHAIRISVSRNPQTDMDLPLSGLSNCRHHSEAAAQRNMAITPMVAVGSSVPDGWSCDYQPQGYFSFGSVSARNRIKPGASAVGYTLKSKGPPGIRTIVVEPTIELDLLPASYNENVEKLVALEDNVKWTGKTVGPVAPPIVFVASDYLDYLISLKDQSVALKWISDKRLEKEFDEIFARAKRKLGGCDQEELKEAIEKLPELVEQKRKGISSEAKTLLSYNAMYFVSRLPKGSKVERDKCKKSHHDEREHEDDRKSDR